jgi:hypothetical protein
MKNVGNVDKIVRFIVVIGLAILGYILNQWVFYVIAGMLLLTIVTGFCGFYRLFGLRTCPLDVKASAKKINLR